MKNFLALTEALEYIERNLAEPVAREGVAAHCFVSLSALEKLFRYALHCSIKEYVTKRRVTQAAKDLQAGLGVTEVALKYQYNSPEVFCRAFKKVWGTAPSRFRTEWKFYGIFPKREFMYKEGDDLDMARKKVDLSEAYDFFKQNRGTQVVCFDIRALDPINKYSREAGDIAIREAAARIDGAAADKMLLLRIGGDEFALVTGLADRGEAQALADRVTSLNGRPIRHGGKEFPIHLWAGITEIPGESLRYGEFFADMHRTIVESKV